MDYKSIYFASLEETINRKQKEIISTLQESKKTNKNFVKISNHLKESIAQEKENCFQFLNQSPDLYNVFKNRYNEYDSDHLETFLEEYSNQLTIEFVEDLGRYEGLVIAEEKYGMTREYLETVYALNESFEEYTLNFSPENNPVQSDLFYKMQAKRFSGYNQEPSWEAALIDAKKEIEEKEKKNKG